MSTCEFIILIIETLFSFLYVAPISRIRQAIDNDVSTAFDCIQNST